ncbi:MAG: hypothetical protein ACE37D_16160 [Pseudomonadales bacterium]
MRELTEQEMDQVSGAGWDDVGTILGGVAAVGAGAVYTAKTGGVGGYFGGGLVMSGGLAAISTGFDGLHEDWYGSSS